MNEIKNFNLYIFGAGRISYTLAYLLKEKSLSIKAIYDRNINNARALANFIGTNNFTDNLSHLSIKNNSIVFLCVSDNVLVEFSQRIHDNLNLQYEPFFVHFSAALSSDVLMKIYNADKKIGSFHIMQSFPEKKIYDIENCYAAIETNDKDLEFLLMNLAQKFKLRTMILEKKDKVLYHLIGVLASNFTVANLYILKQISEKLKIGEEKLFDIILPILNSTINNCKNNGVLNSLSGPVVRGDWETINKHKSEISKLDVRYLSEYYNLLLEIQKDLLSKK